MAGLSVNVLAWLRPERITVHFADHSWALEAKTAADWLGAIAMDFDNLSGVFPGLIQDSDVDKMLHALKDIDNHVLLAGVARNVIQAAGGRDWWWTVNLVRKVMGTWMHLNGMLVRQGVYCDRTNLPDWLDACYTLIWERGDEKAQAALEMELSIPPLGVKPSTAQTRKMLADFQAD